MNNFNSLPSSLATADSLTSVTPDAATALVPVFIGTIQDQPVQLCDARALHAFMTVLRDFSDWIKGRVRKFGFVEGLDYIVAKTGEKVLPKLGENLGGRPAIDYHLTLDMAKELSMVENNAKGREARRYFMACEKQVLAALSDKFTFPAAITPDQAQHLRELVQLVVESGKQGHGETWYRLHRKMKTNSYLSLRPDQFEEAANYLRGKMDGQSMAALIQKHLPNAVPATTQRTALQALPVNQSSQTLQLMRVVTENGVSTVDMLPIEAIPELVMNEKEIFNSDLTLKIASSANLRMMGNVTRTGLTDRFERLQKEVRNLDPLELLTIARDGWMELGLRTALTNELAAS